jgi:hypothetical protein
MEMLTNFQRYLTKMINSVHDLGKAYKLVNQCKPFITKQILTELPLPSKMFVEFLKLNFIKVKQKV